MKFYSGKGDEGNSTLLGVSGRVSKSDHRFEALGSLDELNSYLGMCVVVVRHERISEALRSVQENLFIIQARLGSPGTNAVTPFSQEKLVELEKCIDGFGNEVGEIKKFVVAGGSYASAHLDYARALARRTERAVTLHKDELGEYGFAYLNRISSLLFVLARWVNKMKGYVHKNPTYR